MLVCVKRMNTLMVVSVDDTSLNVVEPVKKPEISSIPIDEHKNGASVQITGISTGIDAPSSYDGPSSPPFKPQRAGTMFARFIDDVFNIPITVLQSVAKLITNPFTSKDKTHESH
ncbi:hypothetical protein WA026_009672 [Henosepilachna vigintioctopunctata]|uniref:Uncharacterized protein n=1 Tax=Henosepilachna vigintioctopunctata TaxID=420089 RepID=A0AAW1U5K2_9CUCU